MSNAEPNHLPSCQQPARASAALAAMPTISGLFVYPVKSLKGIELATAQVSESGQATSQPKSRLLVQHCHTYAEYILSPAGAFLWDRHWLVVRASDGKFYTQRQLPRCVCLAEDSFPCDFQEDGEIGCLSLLM